jgi:hypothetical protein
MLSRQNIQAGNDKRGSIYDRSCKEYAYRHEKNKYWKITPVPLYHKVIVIEYSGVFNKLSDNFKNMGEFQ